VNVAQQPIQQRTTNIMDSVHVINGHKIEYDPTFTDSVIAATGSGTSARLKEIMPVLIRHVHDFAREVNLTTDEYLAGVQLINWAGKMSTDVRNEGQLLTDVIGLESYVACIWAGGMMQC